MVHTRAFQSTDQAQWLPLWNQYLDFYQTSLTDAMTDLTWQRLLDAHFNLHAMGAFAQDGRMLGFAHYLYHPSSWNVNDHCYLEDLFVCPDARTQGVGGALIAAVKQQADTAGAGKLYWLTQEHNERGRRLYDKVAQKTEFIHYQILD